MNEIEIVCGSSPDELRQADHITVNGVEFVPKERHDGAKGMMGDYLNEAHKMTRARDALIRDMYRCISVMHISCDQCDMRPCRFADRMRELGIRTEASR